MNFTNIVFSGGAIKGMSYIGVLKYLEENDLVKNIKQLTGTSIGGFFAFLICLGYKSNELTDIIKYLDFNDLRDISTDSILNFFETWGIDTGNKFIHFIKALVKSKGFSEEITFEQLYNITKFKLTITGTCVNDQETIYYNNDNSPEMLIIDTLRISCSIPILYQCVKQNEKVYVDGFILNNYPIEFFDDEIDKTIGFCIYQERKKNIENAEEYILALINCMLNKIQKMSSNKYKKQTIVIETEISGLNFNLTKENKETLINDGYRACVDYFSNLE
jgi:NTE family protein